MVSQIGCKQGDYIVSTFLEEYFAWLRMLSECLYIKRMYATKQITPLIVIASWGYTIIRVVSGL